MSTTITYKGNTLATVENNTKVLKTAGKYMEGDVTLTDVSRAAPIIQSLSITPSESAQAFNASGVDGYKPVSVSAISSTYVGSGIARKSSTDLTASGATIIAPAGYYSTAASKSVAIATPPSSLEVAPFSGTSKILTIERQTSTKYLNIREGYNTTPGYYEIAKVPDGTAGTPTAAKGTVSNHAVSITPSVTNTTGYITGGTKTGTAVSVSASELVSGTKSITSNGTDIDVTNYAKANVSVTPSLTTLTVPYAISQQTFTPGGTNLIDVLSIDYLSAPTTENTKTVSLNLTDGATYTVSGFYEYSKGTSTGGSAANEKSVLSGTWTCGSSLLPLFQETVGYLDTITLSSTALKVKGKNGSSYNPYINLYLEFYATSGTGYSGYSSVTAKQGTHFYKSLVLTGSGTGSNIPRAITFYVPSSPKFFILLNNKAPGNSSEVLYIVFTGTTTTGYTGYNSYLYSFSASYSYSSNSITISCPSNYYYTLSTQYTLLYIY